MADGHLQEVKVLNTWASMFGMRVLIALKEKGIPYEYQEEDLWHKSHLLLSSNPIHQKVPVLIHNGKPVCESLIAVQYIDEVWLSPQRPSFLPTDPYQRAIARFWADYAEQKIYHAGSRIVRSDAGEQRDRAIKDLVEVFMTLDGAARDVVGDHVYFGGDSIGFVDIVLAPALCWFGAYEELGQFRLPDEQQCPHLRAWAKRVVEYPSVKEAMALAPPHKVLEFAHMVRQRTKQGASS